MEMLMVERENITILMSELDLSKTLLRGEARTRDDKSLLWGQGDQ